MDDESVASRDGTRRIRLRLSERRLDEARFLAALDERSALNGDIDHEFVRRCLINGFLLFDAIGNNAFSVDLKGNNSQYTPTDIPPHATGADRDNGPRETAPGSHQGQGVRMLSGLLGGGKECKRIGE